MQLVNSCVADAPLGGCNVGIQQAFLLPRRPYGIPPVPPSHSPMLFFGRGNSWKRPTSGLLALVSRTPLWEAIPEAGRAHSARPVGLRQRSHYRHRVAAPRAISIAQEW